MHFSPFLFIAVYGLISGVLTICLTIAWTVSDSSHGALGMPIGYLIMLATLSLIFVGVKQHRDRDLGGVIGFVKAGLVGLVIALVATLVYMLVWEGYSAATGYSFISEYLAAEVAQTNAAEIDEATRDARLASLDQFREMYKSLAFRLFVSFTEVFPVGLVVSLLSALLLRNPGFMPTQKTV